MSSDESPNIQQNNEQILNDIQTLQGMEQQLFSNLETNTNLTTQEQTQIIKKMNQLSDMRLNLYKTVGNVNNYFQNALTSSQGTLKEQTAAISIIEQELNKSKQRLEILQEEKNNKIRLVEINDYYGSKYAEHGRLMKIIIFTLVPIIILAVLNNSGILPQRIYYVLLVIVSIIGAYFFWRTITSILMRDAMNYNEYNWFFDPDAAPSSDGGEGLDDPWLTNKMAGTCVGQACCSDGQSWDSDLGQCIGTSSVIDNVSPVTESFMTESMVNQVLTKGSTTKYKQDVTLNSNNSVKPNNSDSFINNRRKN
jgi:hypothetical protein